MPFDASGRWVFDLCAGHLALDFANTVSERTTDTPIERLPSYEDFVRFGRQEEIVSDAEARRLQAWARRHPRDAERVRLEVVRLRDGLYRAFSALAGGEHPTNADLEPLNAMLARLRLGPDLAWHWADGADAPAASLATIARAAVDLLTGDRRDRLRLCDAADCVWVFLDTSKNRTRRWCDMKQCGNREKARRFRHP